MKSLGGLPWDIKLSSAGLVYLHFGKEIIKKICELQEDDPVVDTIYEKVYENFVQEIDAIDNGVNQFSGEARYNISCIVFSRHLYQ